MKKIAGLLLLSLLSTFSFAQILQPAHWSYTTEDLGNGEFNLVFTVTLDEGWHIFSKDYVGISQQTVLTLEKSDAYREVGKLKEKGTLIKKEEPTIEETLLYYEKKAVFTQRVKLLKKDAEVSGGIEYMTCKEVCLPPTTYEFKIKLHSDVIKADTENPVIDSPKAVIDTATTSFIGPPPDTTHTNSSATTGGMEIQNENADDPLWKIFLIGFGYGLLALIQPCVFPIVPLTVSFFTKRSKNKSQGRINAMIYATSILVIFVGLGFLISLIFGSDALNEWSTSWIFNLLFFLLLFLFALSFFGVFEITIPSGWINKTESVADRGGIIGIFFMAFSLVLVSFSCTVPIVGNLLPLIAQGDTIRPLVGMSAFGLALAIPFGFFAWFPAYLQSLPKSGGWMNTVKVTMGFVELALCMIYLSKVDLAYHLGLLNRDVFLSLWIVIFGLLGLYLIGRLRFVHDSEVHHISVPRLFFAIMAFSFSIYMLPGLWGAPLKPISGFIPPLFTQDVISGNGPATAVKTGPKKKYEDLFHSPPGVEAYFDYDEGIEAARKLGKPVMLDFTGWGCALCRKLETTVWSEPEVMKRLNEDYVLISMYVDDKTELPEEKKYISKLSGKNIKTLGNWYSDIEVSIYKTNTQPLYVLLDNNGSLLQSTRSYNLDVEAYVNWLDAGLKEYQKRKLIP